MSTIEKETYTCSVCGKESEHFCLMSSNSFGKPDLDLRPSEMLRSTMDLWIEECPYCGYVSGRVDDPTCVNEAWLKAVANHSANSIAFVSDLAKIFYKSYLIKSEEHKYEAAFYGALHAAWACDDSNDTKSAIVCRNAALELLDFHIDSDEVDSDTAETYDVIRMDLLRRTGQFSKVISEYSNVLFSSDLLNLIKEFQLSLAQQGDINCYTLASIGPFDNCTIRREEDFYVIYNGEQAVTTPDGNIVATLYKPIAERIISDLNKFGYSFYSVKSILTWHFKMIDKFAPMSHDAVVSVLRQSFLLHQDWTCDECRGSTWQQVFEDWESRVDQIAEWFETSTHMQLTAACCIGNEYGSVNIAFVLAKIMEKYPAGTVRNAKFLEIAAIIADTMQFGLREDIFNDFKTFELYYGIHLDEDCLILN